jgi:hypothetical protein
MNNKIKLLLIACLVTVFYLLLTHPFVSYYPTAISVNSLNDTPRGSISIISISGITKVSITSDSPNMTVRIVGVGWSGDTAEPVIDESGCCVDNSILYNVEFDYVIHNSVFVDDEYFLNNHQYPPNINKKDCSVNVVLKLWQKYSLFPVVYKIPVQINYVQCYL